MADITIPRGKRNASINLATGQLHVLQLRPLRAELIEMEDAHFHHDSAVLLPDFAGDPQVVGMGGHTTGIAVLAACLLHARDNPDRKLFAAGHTDTSGGDAYNVQLSELRADNVVAALLGDKDGWVGIAEKKHKVEDYQRFLKWIAWLWGWPCDPGAIDGKHGKNTKAAVESFQHLAGEELQTPLKVDGVVGKKTWGAFFDVMMRVLADVLDVDAAGLSELQSGIAWLDKKSVGCGESFPVEARGVDGLRSTTNRRVELLFFDPGEEPKLACHPAKGQCKKDQCDLYAPAAYVTSYLPAPPLHLQPVAIQVAITEIAGLYKPGHHDPADVAAGTTRRSGYEPGYKSEDDRGRIFVNHIPRASASVDWQDVRKKNKQYIEIAVKVTASAPNGRVPAGTRVRFTWEDPDDPSNAAMEHFSSALVDPNDSGLDPSNDNLGKRDFPKPDAGLGPKFEAIGSYGLEEIDANTASTAIVDGVSKVRMHCTNVGGDNFRVRVGLGAHQLVLAGAQDETGLMTMWKRVDVEYRVMEDADPLPVEDAPPFFEPCFVQMDFTDPLPTPKIEFMGQTGAERHAFAERYVKAPPTGIFVNEGKPGWFLLVAAHRADKAAAGSKPTSLYQGPASIQEVTYGGQKVERLVFDGVLADDPRGVELVENGKKLFFFVDAKDDDTPSKGKTALYIDAIDYQSDFEPGTGALFGPKGAYARRDHYYPRHVFAEPARTWTAGGLGFAKDVQIEVFGRGGETAGTSPENNGHFAGRTIVFTKHPRFSRTGTFDRTYALTVIVHELGHAFGFPHKCGFYTWEDPPAKSCAMNYFNTWLYTPGTRVVQRFVTGETGLHMCARHLHGIRRVHLEDNPMMWKWP